MAKTTVRVAKTKRKLVWLMVFLAALFLLLAFRLFQVMVIQSEELQTKAQSQWTRKTTLLAQRGEIYDRNGITLAQSGTSWRVLINPKSIKAGDRARIAGELSEVLGMDYDTVLKKVTYDEEHPKLQIVLKRQVESSMVDELKSLQLGSGVTFAEDVKRYYSNGTLFAQLIGFTGIDGEGQTGIESTFDSYLAGRNGRIITETDSRSRPLSYGSEDYLAPVNGYDLVLTTDTNMQSFLEKALAECLEVNNASSVSGIIMNPSTGEIYAIASAPTFNLNNVPRDDVTSLMSMARARVASDTFEPGSIFKIVTLAAAIDSGTVTEASTFDCKGSLSFKTEKVRCWRTAGHGIQTLAAATQNSCNVAFMEMGLAMGVDTLYDYIYAFGFGSSTESGVPSEDTGSIIHRKYIRDADLARVSFGQSVSVTALQMASAACAAVNGGYLMQPYVVSQIVDNDGNVIKEQQPTALRQVISAETSATVRRILQSVVEKGSGSNAQVAGYSVGGKTGTAQKYEEDGTASRTRLIASFIGFMPTDKPELLCLIMVDEPQVPVIYGSTVAAPFVGDVLEDCAAYLGILPDQTVENYIEVPDLTGRTGADAASKAVREGFTALMAEEEKDAQVILQIPAAGEKAKKGSQILLYTTMTTFNDEGVYTESATVPNLIGRRRLDAYDTLYKLGLVLVYDEQASTGTVDSQSIAEGTKVELGTEIYVTFYSAVREAAANATPEPTATPGPTGTPQP